MCSGKNYRRRCLKWQEPVTSVHCGSNWLQTIWQLSFAICDLVIWANLWGSLLIVFTHAVTSISVFRISFLRSELLTKEIILVYKTVKLFPASQNCCRCWFWPNLVEVFTLLRKKNGSIWQLLMVCDGATDATASAAEAFIKIWALS